MKKRPKVKINFTPKRSICIFKCSGDTCDYVTAKSTVSVLCCRLLSGEGTEQGWRVLKLVAVLYLAILLGCTALINFSLGFILALTLVPVASFVTPYVPK